jgi:DNA-binding response OmpR family regulator
VLFVSGRKSKEDQQQGVELGAVDYIVKPFEPTDFIFRIKSHAKAGNDFADVPATEGAAA